MNHVDAVLKATYAALGVDPNRDATADSQPSKPSTLQGFASKPPAAAPKAKAKPASGSTRDAVAQLAKGAW